MKRTLLIVEPEGFSPHALEILKKGGFDPILNSLPLSRISGEIHAYEGVIVRFGVYWSRELLANAAALKFIGTPTTGLGHIDMKAAEQFGISVIPLPGLTGLNNITSTSEHALALLLCLLRNICPANRSVLNNEWNRDRFIGTELRGKTIGIIGLGRLGKQLANYTEAFQMQIIYYDPNVAAPKYRRCTSLCELAEESDMISVHAKLSNDTVSLIGELFFNCCKPGAFFVNTARGELVDQQHLIAALESGRLAGAAVDVICNEPETGAHLTSDLVKYAKDHPNLIITPHIGGATRDAMHRTEEILAREIVRQFGRSTIN